MDGWNSLGSGSNSKNPYDEAIGVKVVKNARIGLLVGNIWNFPRKVYTRVTRNTS